MSGLIKAVVAFVLSNYFLTFLVIGLLFSAVAIARAKRPVKPADVIEKLLAWHVFLGHRRQLSLQFHHAQLLRRKQ